VEYFVKCKLGSPWNFVDIVTNIVIILCRYARDGNFVVVLVCDWLVHGWMDGWVDGWMDGWIDGWIDR
jgi:hypothetical protein